MTDRRTPVHRSGLRRARDAALGGVSLLALMLAGSPGEARSLSSSAASIPMTTLAQQAATAAAQQAAAAGAQAQASMARAAAAIAAARKLQQDAAAAARAASSSVPNGLTTGGLMPAGGTNSDPSAGIKADPTKWQNAANPVQTTTGSGVEVDITQNQPKAILYWDTFNVGAKTTVNFNQSASNWIALNRVLDPSLAPSQILGQVKAPGSVYIINRNGIIFGAGSQVNVQSLVASTLDIGQLGTDLTARDQYFLTTGIGNLNAFSVYDPVGGAATALIPGDVTVERGASITANIATDISQLGSLGFVYLFGANVANSGLITVPTGEVGMVAARAIDLVPNGYSVLPSNVLGRDSKGILNTFRGTEFMLEQYSANGYQTDGTSKGGAYLPGTGVVTHDGLIDASRGIVVMNGDTVTIGSQGVISVDTSIGTNAMVLLRAATSVGMNGVISSLPYDDGTTLASGSANTGGSTVQSFTPAYIEMTAQSSVTVGSSGLVSAPSASVALRTVQLINSSLYSDSTKGLFNQGGNTSGVGSNSPGLETVLLAPGATIDVAGLQNVELPASYNFISFQPFLEFADMPLQRNGVLYGQTLWIDIRASGTRSDGTSWVGTPLADASGVVNAVGRGINQLMTTGGTVSLTTDLSTSNSGINGVQTAGSVINMAGGSVKFLPGMVPTTRLLGIDGRIYSMANADPNMIYVGIAGQFTVDHAHWGVSETWSSGTQTFSPGYTQGQDAGGITVTTVNPMLQGTMYFGSLAGERQVALGRAPSNTTDNSDPNNPVKRVTPIQSKGDELPSQGYLALTTPSSVQIGDSASANFTSQSQVRTTLSPDTLSGYGLSALTIKANDLVVSAGNTLNLAPGGSFSVSALGAIDIAGTVSVAGGAINLETNRNNFATWFGSGAGGAFVNPPTDQSGTVIAANVFVEGALDVSGRFVNDTGRFGTAASGPGFIDGGTVSITTNKNSYSLTGGPLNGQWLDVTGSILLAKNSVLDVSSGGYISPQGKPKTASTGIMAGKAGSIALVLYQGAQWSDANTGVNVFPTVGGASRAVIELDGNLRAYGFESNGSLRLGAADTIRVGGTLQPGETSAIRIGGVSTTIPVSLLTGGGFGAYTLESVADGWSPGYTTAANVTVSAGVNLTLQQQNLSSTVDYSATATGTKLGQQSPQLASLPDDQRKPVNLALKADTILLDTGSNIVTDPRAKIVLGGINAIHTLAASDPTRDAPANNVELRGSIVDHGGTVLINALETHLGQKALVDLSGTFVANSRFGLLGGPATSGTYLAGGTLTIDAANLNVALPAVTNVPTAYETSADPAGSYVVAESGAQVDVSGSAGMVQVQGSRGNTSSVWSWSDAGTVSVDVAGFAWGGSFAAIGGRYIGTDGNAHADSRANGGTIILGGGSIWLRQDATDVNSALSAFHLGTGTPPSSLFVSADQLAPFDNVYLYAASSDGGAARIFTDLPGSTYRYQNPNFSLLNITGALNWTVANRLHIAAGLIQASTPVNAQLSAAYVLLTGHPIIGVTPVAGGSTMTVNGQTIDVEGAVFSGFGQVNLISTGDIRLSTPKVANGSGLSDTTTPTELSTFTGSLVSAGNLLLSAQRIYPVSAVDFTIQTPGNVKFAAPAGSSTGIPLSAGGGITVIANTIDQAGNLFAPLGTIKLGNSDSTVSPITTQTVTLEPGSLTSVTLAGTVVPYGATQDGTNWYYNANLDPLSQPPSKVITLSGASITGDFNTIDVRGGGNLQATEWIQGKGGSRDTLTTTPSGQTVYALLPSQNDPVSAFDIHFTTARSPDGGKTIIPGDVYPLAGTQITIAGGNGIPAGTYTLEPAHYATLPGALRVVYYGDNLGHNVPSGTTLPDGTVLVTGQYTQSTAPGKQSSGQSLFAVQTGAVWQQYSEYSFNGANSYFSQQALKQGAVVPRLPMDAGRLAVIAQQSILLSGIAVTQPGQDSLGNTGRGSELDISAPQLAVVGHAQSASNDIPAGYVGLDASQLGGFESILIGGLRSDTTTGTLITPTATNVVVDTQGDTLTAPEILLVSQAAGQWQELRATVSVGSDPANAVNVLVDIPIYQPLAGSGTVTVKTGSIIETTGTVHAGFGRNYYFAPQPGGQDPAAQVAAALGGTLDPSGTLITGVDLTKLPAFWFPNGNQSPVANKGVDITSLAFYPYGGSQQPVLGALFAASNDPSLVLTGPSGVSVPALTIQFANVSSGAVSGVPSSVSGPVSGSLILPASDNGRVSLEAGARISTNTLTLQATAATNAIAINTTDLHAKQVNLTANTIGVGALSPVADKSLVLAENSAQFADVQGLSLKALRGPITVYGDFNPGATVKNLTLDAAGIALGTEALNPGTTVSLRQGALLVFPQGTPAATVQFSVGVSVTSATGATTTYAPDTPITLGANSRVSLADAGTLTVSGAQTVTLSRDGLVTASDNITLTNSGSRTFTTGSAGNGNTLGIVAKEIDLGGGNQTIAGYSAVNWTASDRVFVAGPGTMTLGAGADKVDLTVTTPNILVASATATNSQGFVLTSSGNISVVDTVARSGIVDRPADSGEIGGSLSITAANITVASTIQAQAGTITLDAIAGNVTLNAGAYLAAGGYKKTLVDVDTYVAGGKVVLEADIGSGPIPTGGGSVITNMNSVIDVAQPSGGQGYGGEIDVTALRGGATLAGALRGGGGPGLGGRFKLDINGAADLTALADNLLNGGISGGIDIHTRTGNLDLSQGHTLKANAISLTADDPTWVSIFAQRQFGQVIIEGTIDASGYAGITADGTGQAGGEVGLFGYNGVTLTSTARINASTAHADERGGDVMIGISWGANSWVPAFKTGGIDLKSGSVIDVSGGTKGGLSGGTVTLRAPLDGNNDVKIANFGSTIIGARAVNVQGFLTINTQASPNNINGIDGSQLTTKNGTPVVWDGFIDPAGLVSSNGTVPNYGAWTNVAGEVLNVTPGSGYTAPPPISVVNGGTTIAPTIYIDPVTGGQFYQVTDPVTGTTFRSSLQVASISVTNGGTYTSRPNVTITPANGQLPSWGTNATATANMSFNTINVSGAAFDNSFNGKSVNLLDASGNTIGSGRAVVTNGQLTSVMITSGSSNNPNALLPTTLRVFQNFTVWTDVTTGFSATMSVSSVKVTGGGAGYSGNNVNVGFSGGSATAIATMGTAVTVTSVSKGYAGTNPQLQITGTGTGATVSFAASTIGLSGTTDQNDIFVPNVTSNFIPLATSKVFNGSADTAVLTVTPNPAHQLLYSDVLANFVEGNGLGSNSGYGFSGLEARLQTGLVAQLGASVVHVQPGIDLVNTSSTINSGNITVASNWNLAAGTAGNLQTAVNPNTGQSVQYFDPALSYVNFAYRLATPWGGVDPGALTLRAAGNININASISDGFFQFGNYLDPNYVTWVNTYVSSYSKSATNTREIDKGGLYTYYLNNISNIAVPIAPYNPAANGISPAATDLAAADLFPHTLLVCTAASCSASNLKTVTAPSSWSYRFTGGADTASANPNAITSLASAQQGGIGDVIVDKHTSYSQTLFNSTSGNPTTVTVTLPTMVRTGTGDIDIAAARNVELADTVAPGVIYAAGVNSQKLADPGYRTVNGAVQADTPNGFFEPQVLAYGNGATSQTLGSGAGLYYGPPTAAAFPEQGGDVKVEAQQDILGYNGSGNKTVQYYQPWLLAQSGLTPAAAAGSVSLFGAGVFTPFGTEIASQTAWWIQYGSFQQGILSAGGNVAVTAGRDLVDVSVSLPTTGRVSGGLSATNTPVTTVYGSGNMVVRAGQDILGGSFYEGSGHASIIARGLVGQNGTVSRYATSPLKRPDVPLLAVDTGQIEMVAGGSIYVAGVINPAELHAQNSTNANTDHPQSQLYMDTYGQDSKVRLVATTGDLTITVAPTAITEGSNVFAAASMYPASFEALALSGSLITTGIEITQTPRSTANIPMPGIVLSPSERGTFELLAQNKVDLTFGYPQNNSNLFGTPRPYISAGPALIDTAFDPFQPNSGFDGASSSPILAHQNDAAAGIDTVARIYAATGDIVATGSYGRTDSNDPLTVVVDLRMEINRPIKVHAGRDIVDLNLIVQNIHPSDVSTVEAGRNIYYTGFNNAGGLQVAGPGFFVVQAGGDIGPFLPAAHDFAGQAGIQEGIASIGNSGKAVGDLNVTATSVGIYDAALYGPSNNPRRNALLTTAAGTAQGADIAVLFGVKYGADYQAVINSYIDPANATNVDHNYLGELRAFLTKIGKPVNVADATTLSKADNDAIFDAFKALPADLQHVFIDQVFFAELKAVGTAQQQSGAAHYQPGYKMINTLFPSNLGYTANVLGGGSNGANQLVKTGDLDLLHGTIQSRLGGNISLFGPGGNILVGSLAAEPNSKLKLRDIGILSLGGGDINTFTDQSVLVNSSRVLTTQGGDITMWSSNGDLDAGRGSKTTLSQPALQSVFDSNDYQTIDLGGFVTGAGIGTLQASKVAKPSNLYLLAPRGIIDAGTAGVRASGNAVFSAVAVNNASNIQVQGTTTGVPVVAVPNIGALTSASNTAGAAAKSADAPTATGGNRDRASLFMVEVVGYGGDGQSKPAADSGDGQNQPAAGGGTPKQTCDGQEAGCEKPTDKSRP